MTLIADTQKGATWLSQFITDNGMVKVLAIGFFVLLAFGVLAIQRRWVVGRAELDIYKEQTATLKSQNDNLTTVIAAMDTRDLGKIKEDLGEIKDDLREQARDLEAVKQDVREIRAQGGGRSGS